MAALTSASAPALANGGNGGGAPGCAGAGGIDSADPVGGSGGTGGNCSTSGGGGGGAGVIGGSGGPPGSSGSGAGGAGGGAGVVVPTLPAITAAVTGGAGVNGADGNGGSGGPEGIAAVGGGGGGAGGYGAVVIGIGNLGTLSSNVTGGKGGNGGNGGNPFGDGGDAGTGGVGLLFTNPIGTTVTIDAAVRGGMGGTGGGGGLSSGSSAAGGAGVVGQNLNITLGPNGTIAGGAGGAVGAGDGNAIIFLGSTIAGNNSLTIRDDKSISGRVVGWRAGDKLVFDSGATNSGFNLSLLLEQYPIVEGVTIVKAGSGNWSLTGTTSFTLKPNLDISAGGVSLAGTFNANILTNSGTITVAADGEMQIFHGTNRTGATINNSGTIESRDFSNEGTIINNGKFLGPVVGSSLVVNTGTITNNGEWDVPTMRNDTKGSIPNNGNWRRGVIDDTGTIDNRGIFINNKNLGADEGDREFRTNFTNSGTFNNNGALFGNLINVAGVTTNAGAINGDVEISGGTVVMTATGTLQPTATTAISGGTLDLGGTEQPGETLAQSGGTVKTGGMHVHTYRLTGGTLAADATLEATTFDMQAGTVSGVLRGPGALIKTTPGTVTLSGANTYIGPTNVNGGTLIVNGSLVSAVTVNAGGTLGGVGSIGPLTVNGGVLAPGNSIGTLTVNGNVSFSSSSIYFVEFDERSDHTKGIGTATLGGSVALDFLPKGAYLKQYSILHADGGLGGTVFSNVIPAPNFIATLTYGPNDVFLDLTPALGLGTALPGNASNVANAINGFFINSGILPPAFVGLYDVTGSNLANALTLLSGEAANGGQQPAFQLTNQFLNVMLDPFVDGRGNPLGGGAIGFAPDREGLPEDIALAYSKILKAPPKPAATFEQRWNVWGAGYGGSNRTSGDPAVAGSHDLSARTAGGAAGLDYHLSRDSLVGFALAGGGTNWSLAQGLGSGKSDAFQAGIYGATRWGPAYLAAAFAFTNHWMSTDRFAFAGDHLSASFNAQSYGGRLEGGYRFATFYGGLTPYAAIQAQSFRTPGYSESDLNGGGFALAYNGRTATDTRSELGARFDRLLMVNPDAALTLRARVAWAHDWISDPTLAAVFQTLPGASFIVNGATPAKNSALTSAGAELRLANGVALLAKFDGEFASHSSTYAGTGTLRYAW